MSKLSFRAKALDPGKPLPVYIGEEIQNLPEFSVVNRTVPEMPTGMEKEEETEHHLQRALSAQHVYGTAESLVIPIPDLVIVEDRYRKLYCSNAIFKLPKQYIHVQPWITDQEIPEYDMDSEDEEWLSHHLNDLKMEVTPIKFENMMDRLDKGSGQMVVTLNEAKALLKEDDDLTVSVYDYWLNKRLRVQHSLILQVKTERRDGSSTNNPYIAFRRRAERMQTRKNRKNDEVSYEKMLKLRRDLSNALLIVEILKRREKSKKELLKLTTEVAEKRYQLQDWDGKLLGEANAKKNVLSAFQPFPLHIGIKRDWTMMEKHDGAAIHKKREYKKRKHKNQTTSHVERMAKRSIQQEQWQRVTSLSWPPLCTDDWLAPEINTDDESSAPSDHDGDSDPDGVHAFRRKHGCSYHAPCASREGRWPWSSREKDGFDDEKYKFSITSLGQRCLGYSRRRIGRGGRVIFDRALTSWDKSLQNVDWSLQNSSLTSGYSNHFKMHNIPHFHPTSCQLSIPPSGASESRESFAYLSTGLSAAATPPQLQGTASHNDHPYFATDTCHPEQLPSGDSLSLVPIDSCTVTTGMSASVMTCRDICSSSAELLYKASSVGLSLQEPSKRAADLPVVSSSSQAFCDDVGLSTLPAASILQLNYPLSRRSTSFHNDSVSPYSAPPLTSACAEPTSYAVNHRQIVQLTNSKGTASNINLQHLSGNAQNGVHARTEHLSSNHLNLSALTCSSFAGSTAVPLSILNDLVPVLKLPVSSLNRNDNKQKDARETTTHVAKESVVGVEVT